MVTENVTTGTHLRSYRNATNYGNSRLPFLISPSAPILLVVVRFITGTNSAVMLKRRSAKHNPAYDRNRDRHRK